MEDEVDPYELFGEKCHGHIVYPLELKNIGKKIVYFAIFDPSDKSLPDEIYKQHRACLEKRLVGPNESIRFIPNGFKTAVVSHASHKTGDVRFEGRVIARKEKNNTIYRLVKFDKYYTHKTQNVLHKKS